MVLECRGLLPIRFFKAMADPARRALFERLRRDGDLAVHALTERSPVSQPIVSKHLRILKRQGWCGVAARGGRRTIRLN
jgi:DNA-binding transcriptional ArsR family regulator